MYFILAMYYYPCNLRKVSILLLIIYKFPVLKVIILNIFMSSDQFSFLLANITKSFGHDEKR